MVSALQLVCCWENVENIVLRVSKNIHFNTIKVSQTYCLKLLGTC
jgi:hypothetical protein